MNTGFNWPTLPHVDIKSPFAKDDPEPGLVVMNDGRRLVGHVVRLDPAASILEFNPDKSFSCLSIGFSSFKSLRLLRPVDLPLSSISTPTDTEEIYSASEKQRCTVYFKDGDNMVSETMGHVSQDFGLFLFLLNDDKVVRWFNPAESMASYEIGDLRDKGPVVETHLPHEKIDVGIANLHVPCSQKRGDYLDYLTKETIVSQKQLEMALRSQKAIPQIKLGQALLLENFITEKHLEEALHTQTQDRGLRLGQILVGMGVVSRETITQVLVQKLGFPIVDLRNFQFESDAIQALPASLAVKHTVVPLYRTKTRLIVAMENPLVWDSNQELGFYTKLKIDPVIASSEDIAFVIQRLYGSVINGEELSDLVSKLETSDIYEAAVEEVVTESDSVLVRLVNKIILDAHRQGVSDIHIESLPGIKPSKVRFRKDGVLVPYSDVPAKFRTALISRIKIMSRLDISEKRHAQDGKLNFAQFGPAKLELRVVTIPTTDGLEHVVMRLLTAPKAIPLSQLGLAPSVFTQLQKLAVKPHGLIFVCGPTGSGKTTTLHSLLEYINTPERKIWTAEDPVEITQEGLCQVQVNKKIGWTFDTVLRSFLRADPDVIMVGETRDVETAKTVIEASLTGHLVFSTLHTNSAAESVVRLLDLGLDPFNFADALLAVVGQRLARRLCTTCRKPRIASNEELEILAQEYCWDTDLNSADVLEWWRMQHGNKDGVLTLYSTTGCGKCDNIGYKGRLGIHELLVTSSAVKRKIYSRASVPEILQTAMAEGMQTMRQDGIEKVLQGHTDLEQIQVVCL
ncbi:MAG: ATPase, T2SS/T4P/T4SS family [Pseudomonadota bacterium]